MEQVAYVDGACRVSNPGLAASSYVVYEDGKEIVAQAVTHPGLNTNNYAEYMALMALLFLADVKGWRNLTIYSDSKLVVKQSTGQWAVQKEELKKYASTCQSLLVRGDHILQHMRGHDKDPRVELHTGNNRADELCNAVLDEFQAKEKENNAFDV